MTIARFASLLRAARKPTAPRTRATTHSKHFMLQLLGNCDYALMSEHLSFPNYKEAGTSASIDKQQRWLIACAFDRMFELFYVVHRLTVRAIAQLQTRWRSDADMRPNALRSKLASIKTANAFSEDSIKIANQTLL